MKFAKPLPLDDFHRRRCPWEGRQGRRGRERKEAVGRLKIPAGAHPIGWSSRRKLEIVLRLLKGEDMDAVSREIGVTVSRLSRWRDEALAAAQGALKSRPVSGADEEVSRLRSKVG